MGAATWAEAAMEAEAIARDSDKLKHIGAT
jgi:hypothetical protein